MSRSTFLRFMSLSGIFASILQIIGCFLPFTIWRDGLNQTTSSADSLWMSMIHSITRPITPFMFFDAMQFVLICLFPFSILIPLLISIDGLFGKQQRSFLRRGLVFALLGLLEVGIFAFFNFIFEGWCAPEAMSAADCDLIFPGMGFWLTSCGFLLLVGCFIVSNVLYREPVHG